MPYQETGCAEAALWWCPTSGLRTSPLTWRFVRCEALVDARAIPGSAGL